MKNKIFLLLVSYLLVLILGYYIGKQSTITNTDNTFVTPTKQPKTEADTVTQNFYNWYVNCLNNHFGKAMSDTTYKQNPNEACPYNKQEVLSSELITKLQQTKGIDPILCAQNTPQKVTYEDAIANPNGSYTVVVHTHWGAGPVHNIYVWLQNGLQISDISCN